MTLCGAGLGDAQVWPSFEREPSYFVLRAALEAVGVYLSYLNCMRIWEEAALVRTVGLSKSFLRSALEAGRLAPMAFPFPEPIYLTVVWNPFRCTCRTCTVVACRKSLRG